MNAGAVAELWADLIGEPAKRMLAPTPANPANSANREHSCGLPADSVAAKRCESLRTLDGAAAVAGADSQEFAAVRSMANGLQSQQPCGVSQNSQDSQRCPETTHCETLADGLSAVAWTDADIARFLDRHARLLRWGWAEPEAEKLAERLTLRDREGDDRRLCVECAHYRFGRCRQPERAGVAPDLGVLATMLQRCPAFAAIGGGR